MHTKTLLTTLVSAMLISVSSMALAADKKESEQPSQSMPGMGKMDMHHGMKGRGTKGEGMMGGGMMGGGMMGGGMMEMMHGCKQMMGSGGLPELPAGNEKLQVQMHAEMMQKMGEILGRYADRIKDEKGGVH